MIQFFFQNKKKNSNLYSVKPGIRNMFIVTFSVPCKYILILYSLISNSIKY